MPSYDYMAPFSQPCLNPKSYRDLPSPPKPDEILISVTVPTWKRKKWIITSSIQSIYEENKGFPTNNYEVILVDDATEGPKRQELMESLEWIVQEYPNHNFRAYLLSHTRTWIDSHTNNVGWKRSLGRILIQNDADLAHKGEVLESAWRHHNHMSNLKVCPQHHILYLNGTISEEWMQGYPTEFGASYPKRFIHQVKGKDERVIATENYLEFVHALQNACGVVSRKDPSVYTYHRQGSHPLPDEWGMWYDGKTLLDNPPPEGSPRKPIRKGAPRHGGPNNRSSDGSWTSGDWGVLTPEEEKNVTMTESMRKILEGKK